MKAKDLEQFLDRARKTGLVDQIRSAAFVMMIDADRPDLQMALQLGLSLLMEKPLMLVIRKGQKIPQRLRDLAAEIVELDDAPNPLEHPMNQAKMTAAIVRLTEKR